jgi:hypothetical protein
MTFRAAEEQRFERDQEAHRHQERLREVQQFTYRVDCYRLCPKIDDFQDAHPDWKRDCT